MLVNDQNTLKKLFRNNLGMFFMFKTYHSDNCSFHVCMYTCTCVFTYAVVKQEIKLATVVILESVTTSHSEN